MNYTLHQLRIFLKVCEYQSITRASEALYLSQPAISIQLKKLQDAFDVPLTEVIGRQLHVTEFGEQIRKLAQQIIDNMEEIESATDQYKGIVTGNLKIASASTGKYVIPYFLTGFMRKFPGVNIAIDVTNKSLVVESLQKNEIDFALMSVIPPQLNLNSIPLLDNELRLVAASDYPNLPDRLEPGQLSDYPIIFRERGSATRSIMKSYLNKHNVQVKRSMELVSNEAVKQAVRAGLGLSIMPLIGIGSELALKKMRTVELEGLPIVTKWQLVHSSGKQLSPAAKKLLEHVELHKQKIIKEYFT
jgi:DNA-binding transcriptional LysR family regulator